jgi:hypothetical protein
VADGRARDEGARDERVRWVTAATYASGIEADLAVAALAARGVPAWARSNDTVGIFGPGFAGATARGVDVLVPAASLGVARTALATDLSASLDAYDDADLPDEDGDGDDEDRGDPERRP